LLKFIYFMIFSLTQIFGLYSNSETTDQAKYGGKKSFEVPSAREKAKETRNPKPGVKKKTCKVKVDRVKKSYGASRITT
jgi:hypothetical protein